MTSLIDWSAFIVQYHHHYHHPLLKCVGDRYMGRYSVARQWATSTPLIKCKHDDDEEEVDDDDYDDDDDDVIDDIDEIDNDDDHDDDTDDESYNEVT